MGSGKVSPTFSQSAWTLVPAEGLRYPQVTGPRAVQSPQRVFTGIYDGFGVRLMGLAGLLTGAIGVLGMEWLLPAVHICWQN
jgi:hypothetical protein